MAAQLTLAESARLSKTDRCLAAQRSLSVRIVALPAGVANDSFSTIFNNLHITARVRAAFVSAHSFSPKMLSSANAELRF